MIVPEHQPAVLAKSAATLDALAGGRLLLDIGVGELPEEYAAVGMEFTNRGRRMDEAIEAMRVLWTEEVASYHGRYVDFESVRCDPSPVHGTIPIARRRRVAGRAAARSQVRRRHFPYIGRELDLYETLTRVIAEVRAEAELLGRDPRAIEMTVGGARTVADAQRMAEIGVDRLVIAVRATDPHQVEDELATFGAEVIASTRDL